MQYQNLIVIIEHLIFLPLISAPEGPERYAKNDCFNIKLLQELTPRTII